MNLTGGEVLALTMSAVALIGTLLNAYFHVELRRVILQAQLNLANFENSLMDRLEGKYARRPEIEVLLELVQAKHEVLAKTIEELKNEILRGRDSNHDLRDWIMKEFSGFRSQQPREG